MILHINELNKETLEKLGIQPEASLHLSGDRLIALGKVLKAIGRLESDDAFWVIQKANSELNKQTGITALTTDNNSQNSPIFYIIQVVASFFNLSVADLQCRSRIAELVQARQITMYLLSLLNKYTLREIGETLGGRSPATVNHGFQNIAQKIGQDKVLARTVKAIKEKLDDFQR